MVKTFSTKSLETVKNPLNDLPFIFFDQFESNSNTSSEPDSKQEIKKPQVTMMVQSMSQLEEVYGSNVVKKHKKELPEPSTSNTASLENKNLADSDVLLSITDSDTNNDPNSYEKLKMPEKETIDYSKIDFDSLSIDELLQIKLEQYDITNVKIRHLGYNTFEEYIITEYDVIDNKTNNVLLIVNIRLKQIRFQIPKHVTHEQPKRGPKSKKKPEPTPMEKVARDIQKQLKYSWSDWF